MRNYWSTNGMKERPWTKLYYISFSGETDQTTHTSTHKHTSTLENLSFW